MKLVLLFFLSIIGIVSFNVSEAQNSKPKIGKEPAWITINKIDYNDEKLAGEAEDGLLDMGFEKQVSLADQCRYCKKTIKILSDAGVQNGSEISVNFDPVYEQLTLHDIHIIRDGRIINKLHLSKFKTIQQEKQLERHTYDGSLTALLVLDDVRRNDIIEYSYSIKGFNPVFKGEYADDYDCNYAVPVSNLYYKLIVPANRNINIKNRNSNVIPSISKKDNETIYEWKLKDVSALHLESKTPDWFDPYGTIMVSEFNGWSDVNTWAALLFPRNPHLSPQLLGKINDIKNSNPTNDQRILAALHFVQDEIRYMAVEIGVNSHKPNLPDKIFTQRFGDCKDKSYLLATMLNAMEIEANPVLINTTDKQTITEQLPSPFAFDHCTVQVKANDTVYWFDPTISFQRGSINHITYPDYKLGLVINDTTTGLTTIPFHERGLEDVKEVFSVNKLYGNAKLKVTTIHTGSFADDLRDDFRNNSNYEISKRYKDFYASYFDKITIDSLRYKDDDISGSFTTYEYYTIDDIWKIEDGENKITFSAYVINGAMSKPSDKNRSMPFKLMYPAHVKEELEINMPEDWPIKNFYDKVNCKDFTLAANASSSGNTVTLDYEYENLKDNVTSAEAATFFSKYDVANKDLDYELYYQNDKADSHVVTSNTSSLPIGLFPKLYMALGLCVLITYYVRRERKNAR